MKKRFTATIFKHGINPCVDVPLEVSQAFGIRGNIPVLGTLNGQPFRATLVPLGGGRHRLYINGEMRKAARVDTGDEVVIAIERDLQPQERVLAMPPALTHALEANPEANAAFEQLTPSRRKEILAYLNYLKRPDSVQRNVDKVIAMLTED
jgi:hypothetical protein